jgi:[acyl-carrier-protein] S-malonyltransferase
MALQRKQLVLLFPGQGSIKDVRDIDFLNTKYALELDSKAQSVLGESIIEKIKNSTNSDWTKTSFVQPATFFLSLLSFYVLKEEVDVYVLAAAGHSLGELTALTASGFFDVKTAFRLVAKRGLLMEQCCRKYLTGMLAVVGENPYLLFEIATKIDVFVANLNSPTQVVFAGELEKLKYFAETVKDLGYKTIYLKVQGAFHTPYMQEAAEAFQEELLKYEINSGSFPVYANIDASVYTIDDAREKLSNQIASVVRWTEIIEKLRKLNPQYWVEAFPGTVLLKMLPPELPGEKIGLKTLKDIYNLGR